MPSHSFRAQHDGHETNFDCEFGIESAGCVSNGWDEPGESPVVYLESVAVWADSAPDAVVVYEGKDVPQDVDELCCNKIVEEFDFDGWYDD